MSEPLTFDEVMRRQKQVWVQEAAQAEANSLDYAVMHAAGLTNDQWVATSNDKRAEYRIALYRRLGAVLGLSNGDTLNERAGHSEQSGAEEQTASQDGDEDDETGDHDDAPDIAKMTKGALGKFALENFGAELDMTLNKAELVEQLKALIEARGTE
jgi:hypothetical protein